MRTLVVFQRIRHKCAKLYCPKDWTIALWADFFGDCIKLHALNEVDKKEAIDDISLIYNVDTDIIDKTVQFQKDNGIVED